MKGWCFLEKLQVPQHDLDCCPAPPQSTLPYAQLLTPAVSSKMTPHLVPTSGPLHSSSLLWYSSSSWGLEELPSW